MHAAVLAMLLVADTGCNECQSSQCGSQCGAAHGRLHGCLLAMWSDPTRGAWGRPMPQTCYAPRFGCYPGNNRHMHRYPAFHGTYYRRGYNYRTLFDYPWQAGLHEPTSLFSYGVWDETVREFEGSPAEIVPQGINSSRAPQPPTPPAPRRTEAPNRQRKMAIAPPPAGTVREPVTYFSDGPEPVVQASGDDQGTSYATDLDYDTSVPVRRFARRSTTE